MLNKQIGELIPIESKNGQQAVNARHLYQWLEVKKDFSDWIKVQFKRCDLVENVDYQSLPQKGEQTGRGGYNKIEYALSLNAAKEISMMSQTERGKEARRYFIECERIAKSQLLPSYQIADPIKRAERWIEEEKERQLLQQQNAVMLPKVRTYEQVINTPHDDEWLKTTSSVANEIGMSGQKLNRMLCACGIIYRTQSGEYLFAAEYLRWNLGKTVSCVINEEKGQVKTYIKWNTRGRAYIHALNSVNWDKRRAWHLLKKGEEVVAL